MKQFNEGYQAAKNGEFRAAPKALKVVSPEWKAWYAGYDAATVEGVNKNLTRKFSQRRVGGGFEGCRA